jgi:hypothetical protein
MGIDLAAAYSSQSQLTTYAADAGSSVGSGDSSGKSNALGTRSRFGVLITRDSSTAGGVLVSDWYLGVPGGA